jgi:hypothetical protein
MENAKPTVSWVELLKWPINIAVFELALGYGVGKALQTYFQPAPAPFLLTMLAIAPVLFISAYAVSRYMPSDEALESFKRNSYVAIWINISILLATFTSLLSVLYFNSLLFWLTSVLVASAKALHYLEENRRKSELRSCFQEIRLQPYSATTFFDRHVFSPAPDAYALRPLPTAILFTVSMLGLAFGWAGGKRYSTLGVLLHSIGLWVYLILSGLARRYAISKKPNVTV